MLLPHELCHQLIHWNQNAGALPYAVEGLTPTARERCLTFCRQFGKDASSTLPLGFWVDGVPVKWDRSESIILFTLNFPGQLHADFKTVRIPLTMINKKYRGDNERSTWDHFLELYLSTYSFFPSKSNAWTRAIHFLEKEASW